MNLPYFITWDKQKTKNTFEVDSYESYYFLRPNGEKIIDLTSISFHCPLGGKPKPVIDKIQSQMKQFCNTSPKSQFPLKHSASMRLLNYLQMGHGKIFYTTSGAESVENALKMARNYSGRTKILARQQSYHGATLGALSVTGDWRNQSVPTCDQWTIRIPEPHEDPELKKTEELILEHGPEDIAAFCLETITGGNGVIIPPSKWYQGIQSLCHKYDILLILDEVVGGFNRTGKAFAFQHYKLKPDLICMAKIISAGVIPFGALWVHKKIAKSYDEKVLPCGLTNYAHPLGLAAMDGVLDILTDAPFLSSLEKLTSTFEKMVLQFSQLELVQEVRVKGLLCAIELKKEIPFIKFLEQNLYLSINKKNIVLAPPYIIDESELVQALEKVKQIILKEGL